MDRLVLVGIDPGIVDTGVVSLVIDTEQRSLATQTRVWSSVTARRQHAIVVDDTFLSELRQYVARLTEGFKYRAVGVEGYRQRGRNVRQDQAMLGLIQEIRKVLPTSTVVDNTGIKKVVTEDLLDLFQLRRFPTRTHHADLKSAARVALKLGIQNNAINEVLSDFILDNLGENKWRFKSM